MFPLSCLIDVEVRLLWRRGLIWINVVGAMRKVVGVGYEF